MKAGDTVVDTPNGEIEIATVAWDQTEPDRLTASVGDAIEQLAYDFLEQPHCGWQDNEAPMATSLSTSPNGRSRSITTSATPRPNILGTSFEEAALGHFYHHALSSVKKWGGVAEDYLHLHQWFDEPSKLITADFRHRALRHHAQGISERTFGTTIKISTGRIVPVRLRRAGRRQPDVASMTPTHSALLRPPSPATPGFRISGGSHAPLHHRIHLSHPRLSAAHL